MTWFGLMACGCTRAAIWEGHPADILDQIRGAHMEPRVAVWVEVDSEPPMAADTHLRIEPVTVPLLRGVPIEDASVTSRARLILEPEGCRRDPGLSLAPARIWIPPLDV